MEARQSYGPRARGEPSRRENWESAGAASNGDQPGATRYQSRRSLGSLFGDLTGQMQNLVRLEVQLAKTELVSELTAAGKGLGMMAGAGAFAYAGFLAVVAALGFLLGSFMPTWLGFLIAGVVVLAVAGALFAAGRASLKEADFKLDRTSRTLQEDALWMRQEAEEVRRDPAHLGSTRLR